MNPTSNLSNQVKMDADKKWVWVEDKIEGYIPGQIISEDGEKIQVSLTNNELRWVSINDTQKVNPPKFDKVEDMAELSNLNEASVAYNLKMRYLSNLIYTYSGLFLVAINPYYKLPIYTEKMVRSYKNKRRSEMPPHIYAVADSAYHYMLQNRENQSILITGESGAGKTENTKKVIQYLTSVAAERMHGKQTDSLEQQILRANPILEAFGNAQTIRNNNSSRFGKFIRIEFSSGGQIAGANIEKYLFEKSRVTHQSTQERNYHIFYQFMKGATDEIKSKFLITGSFNDYGYIKNSTKNIDGVDDALDFKITRESMDVMKFTQEQQYLLFRVLAAVLHLGNIRPTSDRDDQAQLRDTTAVEKVCHVLGIAVESFTKGLLRPQMKAGRDWVTQARTVDQVLYSLESLARAIYERMFGMLVEWINSAMDRPSEKSTFIGVLDIAGFEIFEVNSFEQLCINYNNEKLQQFFNHHMFQREQEEYQREGISWKFIDFGLDLQPTIDLIEKSNPIGILSCLDEECVMPKATDKTFTEKLITLWKDKSDKFGTLKFNQGFMLKHYASNVEYRTEGWLDKNKDPLNENITRLLAKSSERYIAELFEDYGSDVVLLSGRGRAKRGVFRTVGQRHKEQLSLLMDQLNSTEPHFVRCILPNQDKKPGKIDTLLVLDQLRCNGVLEGIRICRAGFPNRLPFSEFRQRYEILAPTAIPKGFMDGKNATQLLLEKVQLDPNSYRIGGSKVFFKAGVLAELEETRDASLSKIVSQVQASSRGFLARKLYRKKLDQVKAIRIIQKNARVYVQLREWSWWKLYTKVKPLLNVTRVDEELKKKEDSISSLQNQIHYERQGREELEKCKQELENEKRKLEETLNSERSVALDNAEILRRTQQREQDLEEGLHEMASELELLEAQLEENAQIKTETFAKLESINRTLEEEKLVVQQLEKEKNQRESQIKQLHDEVTVRSQSLKKLESERKDLGDAITQLQDAIAIGKDREADLTKTKQKLEAQISALTENLNKEAESKTKVEEQKAKLDIELKATVEKLKGLESTNKELASQVDKHVTEFSNLSTQLKSEETTKMNLDKQKRDLSVKVEALEAELHVEQSEKAQLNIIKKKLEGELVELQKLIEVKGGEESKQIELKRLREVELTELKTSLDKTQSELQEVKRTNIQLVDSLKSELEKYKVESENLIKSRDTLTQQVKNLETKLESAEQNLTALEKLKRQIEYDMDTVVDHATDLETNLNNLKQAKDDLDRHLIQANSQNEEHESVIARLQREKQATERQLLLVQEELGKENERKDLFEAAKKKLAIDLADLQAQLEESESNKAELRRKLSDQTSELEALKDKYSSESLERMAVVEETKRKLEIQLAELQPAHEELQRQHVSLDKSRARLVAEVEDLKHEIEREHSTARNADKVAKQLEAQLKSLNLHLETERQERESAEANYRKLQSAHASLEKQVNEKQEAFNTISRSKGEMESELRALINEIGEGGRNVHDLEKAKRKLESEVESKQYQLDELQAKLSKADEGRRAAEVALSDLQQATQSELASKDTQLDETRRLLLKEVNQLGERLDEETSAKAELLKVRKRLEDEIDDLKSNMTYSTQSKSDLEKAKSKADEYIKTLQATLESEERLRISFEELSQRHEAKSSQLQSELEGLELQLEATEKVRRQLEEKVSHLTAELEEGESKASLLQSIRKLEKEKLQLEETLLDEQEARSSLERGKPDTTEFANLKAQAESEMKAQLDQLEESRRALLVAQRVTQQDLESKKRELESVIRTRTELQSEIEAYKVKLEEEIRLKSNESASQRRYKRAYSDLTVKLEAEQNRSNEFKEALSKYKAKLDACQNELDLSEEAKLSAIKKQNQLQSQNDELINELQETQSRLEEYIIKADTLEDQLADYENKFGDSYNNLGSGEETGRFMMAEELQKIKDETELNFKERAAELDSMRERYQSRLNELTTDLEAAQNDYLNLQQVNLNLSSKLDSLTSQNEDFQQSSQLWNSDKERLEAKVGELTEMYTYSQLNQDSLNKELEKIKMQLDQITMKLEVKESECISLEKSKKYLQMQVDQFENQFQNVDQSRMTIERSLSVKGQETDQLKQALQDAETQLRTVHHKLSKLETNSSELSNELTRSRQVNQELLSHKLGLEKQVSTLTLKLVDMESTSLLDSSKGVQKLTSRLEELASQVDSEQASKNQLLKTNRQLERQVRELQFKVRDTENSKANVEANHIRNSQNLLQLKQVIDQLETSERELQLAKRRAEREVNEEKERNLRLENEIERLKTRIERSSSQVASPYGSINMKSPNLPIGTLSTLNSTSLLSLSRQGSLRSNKSPELEHGNAVFLSKRSSAQRSNSSRTQSIANSNFRSLLFKFEPQEEQ